MSVAIVTMERPAASAAGRQGACVAEPVREMTSAVARGDPEALARMYRAWFDFAFAEARRCTGRDEHFCLDAVQETMLRVIKRLPPLDSEAALAAWLKTAVRSACVDLLRRELRSRKREQNRAATDVQPAVAAQRHETQERIAWLREQLVYIDPDNARALDLRFRLGWTLARIGAAMHLRSGAVDGRINRTLDQLRAAAQEDAHD